MVFFSGNDIDDALRLEKLKQKGIKNYSQRFSKAEYPKSYLIDFVQAALKNSKAKPVKRKNKKKKKEHLPPFHLSSTTHRNKIWFSPPYIRINACLSFLMKTQ